MAEEDVFRYTGWPATTGTPIGKSIKSPEEPDSQHTPRVDVEGARKSRLSAQ